jgi:transaldolase/glucose-6-phosphate isomerase
MEGLLDGAAQLAAQAGSNVRDDPAVGLGLSLTSLMRRGMDKLTILTSPGLASLPGWMEQLVAESLGKHGTGVVPIADEPLAPPGTYGRDRVFLSYVLAGERGPDLDGFIRAGHPAMGFELPGPSSLGYEMLRAEMMTAVIGAELGVNPFDQPDVEAAKVGAKRAMAGELDLSSVPTVAAGAAADPLVGLLESVMAGDYVGIHAYRPPSTETWARLTELRTAIGAKTGAATTLGWGPRFLHSTGQLHKGGPNSGVFIQLVDAPAASVPVPETEHTFEAIIAAQAAGDHQALRDAGRRVLRIDLGSDRLGSISSLVAAAR